MICQRCTGKGTFETEKLCETCSGTGKAKSFDPKIVNLNEDQIKLFMKGICGVCNGKGRLKIVEICKNCNGTGKIKKCQICGKETNQELCIECKKKPHVFKLRNSCGIEELRIGRLYLGVVSSVTDIGTFVNLNRRLKGLMRKQSGLVEGEEVVVKVTNIGLNGEIDLSIAEIENYSIIELSKDIEVTKIALLPKILGKTVKIRGLVTHMKETAIAKIITLTDGSSSINCTVFEDIDVNLDDVVEIIGTLRRNGIDVLEIEKLLGEDAYEIRKKIEMEIEKACEPDFNGFLIDSEILEKLKQEMLLVAKELKRAIYKSRPVIIRHHWDADGSCGGIAIELALQSLVKRLHKDSEAMYYLVKRRVSRAPFYELEDLVRDLDESLEDAERFGDKIPLVLLIDNGSGKEDLPAIQQFLLFGADVITIDHHYPNEEVDKYLLHHVNPYRVGGDSNITSGILCVEIARMISDLDLKHLAAVSVIADRSRGIVERYIELSGISREELKDIVLAIEYEGFYLRFRSASTIMHEILGFGRKDRQKKLVELLSGYAKRAIEDQLKAGIESVKVQILSNGIALAAFDVENYSRKFEFPPPGKLTGEIHDRLKEKYSKIVTIGFGPDFAVIRSEGVSIDIPKIVEEIRKEIDACVDGGGHLVVGSIKFVQGKKKEVLAKLAGKIGAL
ncbi:MAG: DHH family phosphoesterase [Archaeoglobaceae archaeon]|nr:DHH family phosphoesterase [Archaeoglobaceae archaeon]MDW7989174.1 DHH family phosphoesterase [Archaeoglobaceae archaeon]